MDGLPTEINPGFAAYAAVGAEGKYRQLPAPERDHLFGYTSFSTSHSSVRTARKVTNKAAALLRTEAEARYCGPASGGIQFAKKQ